MKKLGLIISSAIIAVGIVALGVCLKSGLDNMSHSNRVVTVRGLAEREVMANMVTWPISYSLPGNNLTDLYNNVTTYNNIIVDFLTKNGIAKDEIIINPPTIDNAGANPYRSESVRYLYQINSSLTIVTDKVELVRSLLNKQGELINKGIPYTNSYINYEFTGLNEIKPEMIAEATKNAREAANQFAADSDSHLGKIKSASQGQFSIDDRNYSTPYIKKVRVVSTIVYYLED